jgi:hypothetical protein
VSLERLDDIKEQIRQSIDIVDLVGSYLELRRQGRLYVAHCPWHDDTRPSLQVNPERQSWKCWVCGNKGGDLFSFVMEREGIDTVLTFEPHPLHVIHPDEERLPEGSAFRFEGLEEDGFVSCNPADVRAEYERRFAAHVGMGIDRAAYEPGDPMTVVLRVTNATNHMRSLEFRTSQRYDFILLDENDEEVYRWSTGQAFLQVLGEEVLEAGQQRAWEEVLSAPTEPGEYRLQGVIPAAEGRLSTTLPLEVR